MTSSTWTYSLLASLAIAPLPAGAQPGMDILQVMGQFVQANYAASKCLQPDQDTFSRFLANFRIVTTRASEAMRQQNPGMTESQVAESFKKGGDAVAKQIDGVLDAKGCTDPRIQDLLKRFDIQANLKLR